MGIDIRDGQQLECITCALCIDACDDVMAKIGKPRGLIDYMALDEAESSAPATPRSDLEDASSGCARSSTPCCGPPSASG